MPDSDLRPEDGGLNRWDISSALLELVGKTDKRQEFYNLASVCPTCW